MLDDIELERAVQDLLLDVCEVMYHRGYETVSVGAMMRLVGVGNERAQEHDNDFFALDLEFLNLLQDRKKQKNKTKKKVTDRPTGVPPGVTLH